MRGHTSGEVQFTLILLNQNVIVETVINMIKKEKKKLIIKMVKESLFAMNYHFLSQESSSSHAVILLPSKVTAGLSCIAPNKLNQTRRLKKMIQKTHTSVIGHIATDVSSPH